MRFSLLPPARNLGKFQKMRFMATFFAEMLLIFSKSDFDYGNGYFDNDNGQTLFLGKTSIEKKRFLSGIARIMGGGSTHARIFWPSF